MVRTRRLTSDDVFQPLGDIALGFASIGIVLGFVALVIAALLVWAISEALEWLQEQRFLGPITFAVMVAVVLLHLVGCASTPTPTRTGDPRDPEIWKPTAPAVYPLPR